MNFSADRLLHENPHGSPHGMAWRNFSSSVYLNDAYDGGELKGEPLTLPAFCTVERAEADFSIHPDLPR